MCVEKVWISPFLSVLTTLSQWHNACVWDLTGWVTSPWEGTSCRHPLLRLGFFHGETQWGTFQIWDLSAKTKSKKQRGWRRTRLSVKHLTSDDPAILYLISSNTTRLVISLSSRETPDATRAAMVTEKHLASRSVAWVGSVLPSMHFAMRCLLQVLEKWIQISSFCTLTKSWCMNVPNTELSSVLSRTALMGLY